jgi:uncharacterized membrane protein YidH (DUF202 family)
VDAQALEELFVGCGAIAGGVAFVFLDPSVMPIGARWSKSTRTRVGVVSILAGVAVALGAILR